MSAATTLHKKTASISSRRLETIQNSLRGKSIFRQRIEEGNAFNYDTFKTDVSEAHRVETEQDQTMVCHLTES